MSTHMDRIMQGERIVLLIVLSIFHTISFAQRSLIKDGGFEAIKHFENGLFKYLHWDEVHFFKNETKFGTPDYNLYYTLYRPTMKAESTMIWDEYFKPKSGIGLCYSQVQYLKNLYQSELESNLQLGELYKIVLSIKIHSDNVDLKSVQERLIDAKIGVLLSVKDIAGDDGMRKLFVKETTKITPSIVFTIDPNKNISKWVEYSYIFKADKAYKYILIGNFNKLFNSWEIKPYEKKGVLVLYDDIGLYKI